MTKLKIDDVVRTPSGHIAFVQEVEDSPAILVRYPDGAEEEWYSFLLTRLVPEDKTLETIVRCWAETTKHSVAAAEVLALLDALVANRRKPAASTDEFDQAQEKKE